MRKREREREREREQVIEGLKFLCVCVRERRKQIDMKGRRGNINRLKKYEETVKSLCVGLQMVDR